MPATSFLISDVETREMSFIQMKYAFACILLERRYCDILTYNEIHRKYL